MTGRGQAPDRSGQVSDQCMTGASRQSDTPKNNTKYKGFPQKKPKVFFPKFGFPKKIGILCSFRWKRALRAPFFANFLCGAPAARHFFTFFPRWRACGAPYSSFFPLAAGRPDSFFAGRRIRGVGVVVQPPQAHQLVVLRHEEPLHHLRLAAAPHQLVVGPLPPAGVEPDHRQVVRLVGYSSLSAGLARTNTMSPACNLT